MVNFRVIVHMHNFFADHRSLCRLFVTADMKTVRDLQDHIARLFHLKDDFYLLSDRLYLPKHEDVRVLKEDDTVVVIPCKAVAMNNSLAGSVSEESVEQREPESKRKRSLAVEKEDELAVEKSKKKKKQKSEAEHASADCGEKKKKPKERNETGESSADVDMEKSDGACTAEQQKEETKVKTCNGSDYSKMPVVITRSKPVKPMPICTTPKVVKSVQVRDATPGSGEDIAITSIDVGVGTDLEKMNVDGASVKSDSVLNGSDDCSESVQSVAGEAAGSKRKRKRVRKRRQRELTPHPIETPATTKPTFQPPDAPRVHIRYKEEEGKAADQGEAVVAAPDAPVARSHKLDFKKLCLDQLTMHPLMRDTTPRAGDIITFKKFTLSNSYTPELFDIVAKVLNYCFTTNQVKVQILVGSEHLKTPEGKFHMELDDEAHEDGSHSFCWDDLVEPRLMFP